MAKSHHTKKTERSFSFRNASDRRTRNGEFGSITFFLIACIGPARKPPLRFAQADAGYEHEFIPVVESSACLKAYGALAYGKSWKPP